MFTHVHKRSLAGTRTRRIVAAIGLAGLLATLALGAFPTVAAAANRVEPTPNPSGARASFLEGVSCTSAAACNAVGFYVSRRGSVLMLVEHWNGTRWVIEAAPEPGGSVSSSLSGVSCSSAKACMAVGFLRYPVGSSVPLAEHWNGTSWSSETPEIPSGSGASSLGAVSCTSARSCTAVGSYEAGLGSHSLVEHWNGRTWKVVPTQDPANASGAVLAGVSCASATACLAVGTLTIGLSQYAYAQRWNGTSWTLEIPHDVTSLNGLTGVSCTRAMICAAVGWYEDPVTHVYGSLGEFSTAPYNWAVDSTPSPGVTHSSLTGVSCTSATHCTAVGRFDSSFAIETTFGAFWDGINWSLGATPTVPFENTYVNGSSSISCPSAKTCTVAGFYKNSAGTFVTFAGQGA